MTGTFEYSLELLGTAPDGFAEATVKVTGGTLRMDRSWAPAVEIRFTVPFAEFDPASWLLIEPTLSAKFGRFTVSDLDAGRLATWKVNLRYYKHDAKAGTVELVARSFENVVQDYGQLQFSGDYTDTAVYPDALSIVQLLCRFAAGVDVCPPADWTAPLTGPLGPSNELRFVVNGVEPWNHIQATAAAAPGGIVQHYGYSNNEGTFLNWVLTSPTFSLTPSFAYLVPAEPDPALGVNEGSARLVEWQAERSRDAEGWGDAMYVEFPAKQLAGSVVFTTSGYVMDYQYNQRGIAGSTSAKRKQAQATSNTRSTPDPAGRDAVASQRLTRAAPRAVQQTYTQPLEVRLLPWQIHQDENGVDYMVSSITHNLTDGTSVVSANRL